MAALCGSGEDAAGRSTEPSPSTVFVVSASKEILKPSGGKLEERRAARSRRMAVPPRPRRPVVPLSGARDTHTHSAGDGASVRRPTDLRRRSGRRSVRVWDSEAKSPLAFTGTPLPTFLPARRRRALHGPADARPPISARAT